MSKRINAVQHVRNNAATEKAASPLTDAFAAIPGVPGVNTNPFVHAAKKVAAGKIKVDHKAQDDADAATAHKSHQADAAHDVTPVESTTTGGARMVMVALDAAADQAGGSGSAPATPAEEHHNNSTPIILGVGAVAIGGAVAAFAGGGSSSTPAPTNTAPNITSAAAASAAENAAITTVVYQTTATDAENNALTYTLSGTDAALFAISTTGAVTFKASPNFEAPTDAGANNVYDIKVNVSDGSLTTSKDVAITVTNVNEAPTMPATNSGTVAENTAITTTVLTATATDVDAGDTLTYTLTGTDATAFAVSSTGVVTFKASPDFETKSSYSFNVVATDKAGLTATQAETVTVTNVNEAPTITSNATANVAENSTAVTTVTATDVDAGDTKTFSISGGVDQTLFTIDSATGALAFKAAPNFEAPADVGANNVYDVNVRVTDKAGLFADKALAITVTDVNEAPTITSAAAFSVAENNTTVGTITSTDPDTGATKNFSISGTDSAFFTINAGTGALAFKAAPNFEAPADNGANNVYDLTVSLSDGTNTVNQNVAVTVTNLNEPPVIGSNGGGDTAAITINENTTAVTTVTSTDPDAGATKTFSIAGGADSTLFQIDSTTGVLSFKAAPNFETPTDNGKNNVYDVNVQVSDGTNTDTQAIAVTVADVQTTVQVDTFGDNSPPSSTSAAGAEFTFVDNADVSSGVIITGFSADDFVRLINTTGNGANGGASFGNAAGDDKDIRIDVIDASNNVSTIILDDVNPNHLLVFDLASAQTAIGRTDFFSFA